MSIEFMPFRHDADLVKQRELFGDSFPESIGTPLDSREHYDWKFSSFPYDPPSYEYAAYEGERLLGYYAAIPYPYMLNGRRATCGMVCDVMTHSSTRRKGVFTNLGRYSVSELAKRDLDFLTGYPIRPEVIPGHLKVGWRVAFQLPMYMKSIRVDSVLASKGLRGLTVFANAGAAFYDVLTSLSFQRTPRCSVEIIRPAELDRCEDYERFFDSWRSEIRNHLIKSREFLAWRLGAPGAGYYVVILRDQGGRIAAMAIARPTKLIGVPCLALLDLMIPSDKRVYCGALYRTLTALAISFRLESLVVMLNRAHAKAYGIVRHGFVPSPFIFTLITYPLKERVYDGAFGREEDWRLMWIDSDDL